MNGARDQKEIEGEIDALKDSVERATTDVVKFAQDNLDKWSEIQRLKAENEKLRKLAERFIEYFNPGADSDRSVEQVMAFLQDYEDDLLVAMTTPNTEVRDDQS